MELDVWSIDNNKTDKKWKETDRQILVIKKRIIGTELEEQSQDGNRKQGN